VSVDKLLSEAPSGFSKAIPISSPVSGTRVLLPQTQDPLIRNGAWGPGVAIDTSASKILAPFNATILKLDALDYAIELKSSFGLKCRIKYGYDTTSLHGAQFQTDFKQGSQVKAGATLFTVNTAWLKQQGIENICIMTILNAKALLGVLPSHQKRVEAGADTLLTLYL